MALPITSAIVIAPTLSRTVVRKPWANRSKLSRMT
jgi:hypothetical protein